MVSLMVQMHALDEQQAKVAHAPDGPLLVLAGAGTGKTHALMGRVGRLIEDGVEPSRIMVVTFTQKSAHSMIERLQVFLPDCAADLCAGTFHGIGLRFLRTYAERLNFGPSFRVLSAYQSTELLTEVMASLPESLLSRLPDARNVRRIQSLQVNSNRSLGNIIASGRWQLRVEEEELETVFLAYVLRKLELNVMDYDDLLANWLVLMTEYEDVLVEVRTAFDHVLVDEYQDINPLQASLLELVSAEHGCLTVVGDSRQAIYGFRGADVSQITSFSSRTDVQTISLDQNYRSTSEIVAVANACDRAMLNGHRVPLRALYSAGQKPVSVSVTSHELSARFVAQRIKYLVDEGLPLSEQAVLYRTHVQGRAVQIELQRLGIAHRVMSGGRFFDLPHVRDAVAHLRIVTHPDDWLAWMRSLQVWPGVGPVMGQRLVEALSQADDPWSVLAHDHLFDPSLHKILGQLRSPLFKLQDLVLADDPGSALLLIAEQCLSKSSIGRDAEQREKMREDLHRLVNLCREDWCGGQLLDGLALDARSGTHDRSLGVTLSTIHQSKGLEWDAVFLVGLTDGLFPLRPMSATAQELDEERRLFYVALTRAKKHLYLCHPPVNPGSETEKIQWPSRFVLELDEYGENLLERWVVES